MTTRKYWLKAIGLPEHKLRAKDFIGFTEKIHFPENPRSISPGDWLILVAVGHAKIIGVFEADSVVKNTKADQIGSEELRARFPFCIKCRNLAKLFSNQWLELDVNPFSLDQVFFEKAQLAVTAKGNHSVDGMMHGPSHIELTEAFALFLIKEMNSSIEVEKLAK